MTTNTQHLSVDSADMVLAFEMAPVGLLVSRNRVIQSINQAFSRIFEHSSNTLTGKSLALLYPSVSEFEHIGDRALACMKEKSTYSDERIMRRADGHLFWCHVTGQTVDRTDPFSLAVWTFEDISEKRPVTTELTAREREVAQYIVQGKSSKEIGKLLGIGPRTIDGHRARLMRKHSVSTSNELVAKLSGQA